MRKIKYFLALIIIAILYYQIDYKRYFIYSSDKTKCFTIWKRYGHHSYIIPGKYYSPFIPKSNYLYIKNQYFGVIFEPYDSYEYKLGVYPKTISHDFDKNIGIYKNNDSLIIDYHLLERNKNSAIRRYSKNRVELQNKYDYKLISLETLYGINILIDGSKLE